MDLCAVTWLTYNNLCMLSISSLNVMDIVLLSIIMQYQYRVPLHSITHSILWTGSVRRKLKAKTHTITSQRPDSVTKMNQGSGDVLSEPYTKCFNLSHFGSLSLIRGSTAGFCFFLCCLTLVLTCVTKTWQSVHQRLFLYLTVSTVVYLAVLTFHIEHFFDYSGQNRFCVAIGFLDQYTGTVQLFFALGITLFLFADVCLKCMKKDCISLIPHQFPQCCRTQKCAFVLEVGLVGAAISLPIIISIIPFLLVSYGETGPWCWIKTLEDHRCKDSTGGFWEQMGLWYIPFATVALLSFLFILMMVAILVYWRTKLKASPQRASRIKSSIVEACPLTLFLVAYCLLLAIEFVGRIAATTGNTYWVWAVYAFATPFSGAILPIAFLVYYFTKVIREKVGNCLGAFRDCCFCRKHEHEELRNTSVEEGEPIFSQTSSQQRSSYHSITEFHPTSVLGDWHNSDSGKQKRTGRPYMGVNWVWYFGKRWL